MAEANLAIAAAELKLQQADLEKSTIYAPIDGIVLTRSVDPGQTVASSLQAPVLFVIAADLTQMELKAAIDEADIGGVKPGQQAHFTVDAFPDRRFDADIRDIAFASVTTEGVVTYDARLDVDNAELLLRPGMTATVAVIIREADGVLTVPSRGFPLPAARRHEQVAAGACKTCSCHECGRRPAQPDRDCRRWLPHALRAARTAPAGGTGENRLDRRRKGRNPLRAEAEGPVITAASDRPASKSDADGPSPHLPKASGRPTAGRNEGPCSRRHRPRHRQGRIRGDHGSVRFRQIDGDEHHRLPRHADRRASTASGHRRRAARPQPPRGACATSTSASYSRATICFPARRRWKMSNCRSSIAASGRASAAPARWKRSRRSV